MGCPDGMRKSKKGGCVDANEDKINKLFESRRKKLTGPRGGGNRIIQNDWGSCRYNGFWHATMPGMGITERTMNTWCEDINNLPVPDQYNYCDDIIFTPPGSQRTVKLCRWDWWDKMSPPSEEQ